MFNYFKKIAITKRMNDELFYEFVIDEMRMEIVIRGLWGKALANSYGNKAKAKSLYIQYRVQSIKDLLVAQKIAYEELTKNKLFQSIQELNSTSNSKKTVRTHSEEVSLKKISKNNKKKLVKVEREMTDEEAKQAWTNIVYISLYLIFACFSLFASETEEEPVMLILLGLVALWLIRKMFLSLNKLESIITLIAILGIILYSFNFGYNNLWYGILLYTLLVFWKFIKAFMQS